MRILKSTTSLTPIALLLAPGALHAQVTISTATTAPLQTSTVNGGAAADISIVSGGSVTVNGGSAITVDSNNSVSNAGTIATGAPNNSVGIDVLTGTSSTITNTGTISVVETFNAPNVDGNGIVDGDIAQATNRAGIWLRGTHTGNVVQGGTLNVDGKNSAGVRIDGTLTGSLLTSGPTFVRGENSVGVSTQAVTGNVVFGGSVDVVGRGTSAVNVGGDVGGYVRFENGVGQQSSFTDDNGSSLSLQRTDLNVGAPAVSISGNVGAGIIVATAPTINSNNPDNDGDGVADTSEATGFIQSFGTGPAMLIGSASRDITIGSVSGDTHGIVIAGTVTGTAYYSRNDSIGMQIGGLGGNVTVAGGLSVSGTLQAGTVDSGATALLIYAGSSVPVIDNTGTISATITSPGGATAYAVRDLSGTLSTINNSGFIKNNATAQDTGAALDLSANTSGVTITQTAPATTTAGTSTINPAPLSEIVGNILTGTGNDTINLTAGEIAGTTLFGGGNDRLLLTNDAVYSGTAHFQNSGTGTLSIANTAQFVGTAMFDDLPSTMTLSDTAVFRGSIAGGANLAVTVNGGTFEASGATDANFKTLTVGANGTISIDIDTVNHVNTKFNVNTATFASGSKVAAAINSLTGAEGTYVVLNANTLNGTPVLSTDAAVLPFMFTGTVAATTNQITLTIQRKTTDQLGLNRAEASIFDAIMAAAPNDADLAASLLDNADQASFKRQYDQLLPDHSGGNFDLLTRGSRQAARHLTDNNAMFDISDLGGWTEVLKFTGTKKEDNTSAFRTTGWGFSGGVERVTDFGNIGLSFDWISGYNRNTTTSQAAIHMTMPEVGLFWRTSDGPFYAFARATAGFPSFKSTRNYDGFNGTGSEFTNSAKARWRGNFYSGMAGASYEFDLSDRVGVKPMATFDYFRLREKNYVETGAALTDGSDAIDLTVQPRTSETMSALTSITGIYRFGSRTKEGIPLTLELEGGRRNTLGGTPGTTTANFMNGDSFSILSDKQQSAWTGELRLLSGGLDYTWQLAGGLEETQGAPTYNIRFSLGVAF